MADTSKHILLISYTFPPYPGIGGRRWAKFAKFLSKQGYTVHVIHSKNPFSKLSLWIEDVDKDENIKSYELPSFYPKILLIHPKTFFEKANYKLSLLGVKLLTKGTPYDRSVFWKKPMLSKSIALIKEHDIKNVIVSSAPFSSAFHALELKKYFNHLNLIIDFRDPWTWGVGYGFAQLRAKRLEHEKQMEYKVVKGCDTILVPAEEMKDYFDKNYSDYSDKISVLPHGFDEDEVYAKDKISSDVVRCMFYGTLYNNLDVVFKTLASVICNSGNKLSLDIYSSTKYYKEIFDEKGMTNNLVKYHDQLPPKELFSKTSLYDYVLIVQPDNAKDFITTKIYEIIYSKTPILLISKEGQLSRFILKNNLGLCFTPDNFLEVSKSIVSTDPKKFKLESFPIENYSFTSITRRLTSYFKYK